MNESERLWKSLDEREEAGMDTTFTPDQLCAMARSRERESIRSRRILLIMLIGLAGAFAYNTFSVSQLWVRLSQCWLLAWACLVLWRFRRGLRGTSTTETCASFLRREFESKRNGLLEIRRYLFLLIPSILGSWWGGGPAIRLRAMGVNPSSRVYEFASGPWLLVMMGFLLALIWIAFGVAARKAAGEFEELGRRTRE